MVSISVWTGGLLENITEVTTIRSLAKIRAIKSQGANKAEAMPTVGIRELKVCASAIIGEVTERAITYAVTKGSQVASLMVPVNACEYLLSPSPSEST